MKKLILPILSLCIAAACEPSGDSKDADAIADSLAYASIQPDSTLPKDIYTFEGDSVLVAPFEFEVELSPNAKDKILSSKETIVVSVFLEGEPKDSLNPHIAEDGSFYVASADKEINYGEIARFDKLRIPMNLFEALKDKDVNLTVNVFTGRKSSQYNLITGDLFSTKLSNVVNKHFKLEQKLIIGED